MLYNKFMNTKTFFKLSTAIFSLIALLHIARLIYSWEAVIGGLEIPLWISLVAVIAAGFMAYNSWKLGRGI